MKKIALVCSFIISLLILVGCSSTETITHEEKKVSRKIVVTSANPADVLPAFTTFTWNNQYRRVLSAVNDDNEMAVQQYIQNEIIRYLKTKGYEYRSDPTEADVVVGFLFALEDDLADQTIQDRFGLLPGVSSAGVTDKRYEKGTFLLAILDADVTKVYWRSAMQGFVDFDKDRKDVHSESFQKVLSMMMKGFPIAGR